MTRRQRKTYKKSYKALKKVNYFLILIMLILLFINIFFIYKYNFLGFKYLNQIYPIFIVFIFFISLVFQLKNKLLKVVFAIVFFTIAILTFSGLTFYSTLNVAHNLNKTTSYSKIEMSIVVLKDSSISNVSDLSSIAVADDSDSQNIKTFLDELKNDKGISLQTEKVSSYQDGYEKLLNGEKSALVLNSAYSSLLETIDPNFEKKIKTIYSYKIKKDKQKSDNKVINRNIFNIYISGIDTYGDISTVSRSDVNIIMTVNMNTHKVLLTTTPRDAYVKIPDGGANQYDKLTHAGIYGVETSMETLENLYGIDINYYTRINFTSFLKLIDLIGGVEVYNEQEFTSLHGNYDFPVGKVMLDSDKALGFIRERYSLSGGDNDRGKNQEKVIAAIINKLTATNSISKMNQIVDKLQDSVQTNMTIETINQLVNNQLSTNQHFTVTSQAVVGTGSVGELKSYAMPTANLYMMSLDPSSVNQVKAEIENVMEGK